MGDQSCDLGVEKMKKQSYGNEDTWFGKVDTPAPQGPIADPAPMLTVAVAARHSYARVVVRYRRPDATWQNLDVRKGRSSQRAQYYTTRFPRSAPGIRVEYEIFVRLPGKDHQSEKPIGKTCWFEVTAQSVRRTVRPKRKVTRTAGNDASSDPKTDAPAPAAGPQHPTIITASPSGTQETRPSPSTTAPAEGKVPSMLRTRRKKRFNSLKRGLGHNTSEEKFDALFKAAEGDYSRLTDLMAASEDFNAATIRQLNFTHELADLTEDNEELVGAFLSNPKTNSLRDIALNFKKDQLKALVKTKAPADDREKAANHFHDRLFRMAPAAVIHRMTRDNEFEAEEPVRRGVLTFFEANPKLDLRKTSVLNVLKEPDVLNSVPEKDRDKIIDSLKSFQRLSAVSPKAEALPTLMKVGLNSAYAINEVPLERFVDLYRESLGGEGVARRIHAQAQNISVRNEHAYVALRDAVLSAPVKMIGGGQSVAARQAIAQQMAQEKNIPINFETLFGSVDLCECKHCNSVYSPAAYLVELFQYLRNNNLDPENPNTGIDGLKHTPLKKFFRRRPDLGKLQLTCENTHTLIPYIDLVNEVMESFVAHLNDYEQDNHQPKQAKIAVHNVEDESSGELLAEPQHTQYRAYKRMKNTVYPVCKLPYHQPIDTTRQYLNFLGSSRYELFTTFRRDVSVLFQPDENTGPDESDRPAQQVELKKQSVDRAIAAEYLELVQEEYVILTKEGFHSKKGYELREQESLTLDQYHEKIGLKRTWHYYGIGSENQMLAELKWVRPAQETGIVGFLRRVNLRYVDLVELLKTRYINPNYPSGKALAFLNSLPYSYLYLRTLVDESQSGLKKKYEQLINFLIRDISSYADDRFSHKYVACWVYTYFEKIGKLIVLENASSCNCIEGTFRLPVIHIGDDAGSFVDLSINANCEIHIKNSTPKKRVGHLDTLSGKLVLNDAFLDSFAAISDANMNFTGKNGEKGHIRHFTLHIGRDPFKCIDYQETCDISKTQLKHLDGTDLVTSEYDRMHRFIRLWCKLDWSVAEVDQAITGIAETAKNPPTGIINFSANENFVAFNPTEPPEAPDEVEPSASPLGANRVAIAPESPNCALSARIPEDDPEPFLDVVAANRPVVDPDPTNDTLTLRPLFVDPQDCKPEEGDQETYDISPYLIDQLVAVIKLQKITGLELPKLLTYWTSIGIAGEEPLYDELFLKYNPITEDDTFQADRWGTYLTREESISDHLPALMAAFKVDVAMLQSIMSYAGIDDDLNVPNVSHLYRHILLAKSLGLRVKQLPALFELIKDQGHPFSQPTHTLRFYRLFERIDESGFDTRELNYMIRNEDDPERPLRPDSGDIFRLAIGLRNALLQIEADHGDIGDDEQATEELLREKLSLLLDDAVVNQILNLVQGTTVYEDNTRRKFSANLTESDRDAIIAFILVERKKEAEEPGGEFETFLRKVRFSVAKGLQVTGILGASDRDKLFSLADLIEDEDDREKFLIAAEKMLAQPELFFDDALASIFNDDTDSAKTIILAEDIVDSQGDDISAIEKRAFLTRGYLPYLREHLRRRQVVQILSSGLGIDQDVVDRLVMEVIKTGDGETLYEVIIRLKLQKDPVAEDQDDPLEWEGFFVPEQDGHYTFLLGAEGASTLTLGNQNLWNAPERTDEELINIYQSRPIYLKAGQTYPFLLHGYDEDEAGKVIDLFMKIDGRPKIEISDKYLFPALRTKTFKKAYIRLHKAAMLLGGFGMTLTELDFFRDFDANFDNLDFNALSFKQWLRLEAYYRLQKSLRSKDMGLIEFLRWTNSNMEDAPGPSLVKQITLLTGWEESDVDKLIRAKHFNLSHPDYFRDERNLLKLQDTMDVAKKIGVGIDLLFQWGRPTSLFKSTRRISRAIREAIKARYSQQEWEEAIKPVHDQLRENQKQALIAYLLAQPVLMNWGVRDADSLFEFFLIDVQMDACMETSRIKQAISSVQLFVQRSFLGLEVAHGIGSEILDRLRWEWMSRYRVWEANRKVFLYPENWIRPELRDDKSPFFNELESELLQNDVSQDTVKSALTKYIVQVDEVANLEIVGQHLEGNVTSGKLHVIGRTRTAPYFFHYRYYVFSDKYWYPWEKIEVDIPAVDIEDDEGNLKNSGTFVVPVVWNDRLFIFFPEFMKKNYVSPLKNRQKIADGATNDTLSDTLPLFYWEIKMGLSEYKEGKWTPKQLSKLAIHTKKIRDNVGKRHEFDLFLEREKFIFAPFERDNGIHIQPYYLGKTLEVQEDLLDDETRFRRRIEDNADIKILIKSFRFDGNQITIKNKVSSTIPDIWHNGPYEYHAAIDNNGSPILLRIQAGKNETSPSEFSGPYFWENNNKSQIAGSQSTYKFHHPKVKNLLGHLRKDRLNKIFNNKIPLNNDNYGSNDGIEYHELKRPYSIYNWEALFHAVGMLADNLSRSHRFEESMNWWHYIFDPIAVKGDIKKVWNFRPLRAIDSKNALEKIFSRLDPNTPDDEITEWRENPFMPHVIARSRSSAYMKWVVMKYIDNLIAWGDSLFRQHTIEAINQATQLYALAGHILGPRPEIIPKRGDIRPKSYLDLVDEWDAFSNAMVDLELIFPFSNQIETPTIPDDEPHYINIYGFATTLYFCIPDNPKLLEYWDTVADRLFKIRHCLDIEGIFKKLNLFAPPIDPALLVQAASQGLSIGSVLNDLSTPMPNYRFNYLLARALEVTSEVKSIGTALLSALEKRDGESLSLMRSRHDTYIQSLVMEIRNKQLEEAQNTKESLEENRKAPEYRLSYYSQLLGKIVFPPGENEEFSLLKNVPSVFPDDSGELSLNTYEIEDIDKASEAKDKQKTVGRVETLASILHLIPNLKIDIEPLGVGSGFDWGGPFIGGSTQAIARGLQISVNELNFESGRAGKKSGFLRQLQDRVYQANLALHEIKQIDKQITAQNIRIELAEQEITNHQVQIDQTKEVEEFIRSKFSNKQLYQWMGDQLKDLYYQTYSFAYDLAKKAEKVYRFEMGLSMSDFVKFGYWNSSKDGFLAGEQLYLALKQLENAYIETKPHDYEITKHISLRRENPLALIQLKEQGVCEFHLAEELYDLDYPGQYRRRIKTVAVSIPSIVGPHTSLNCTLRLLKHEYRNSKIAADYPKNMEEADERFVTNPIPTTAIAVSQGQNDSGVFELTFQSERYLPFEGSGAISSWRLELPQQFRQFDYQTITDVVIHLRYTSREGGNTMKTAALEHLSDYVGNAAELSKTQGMFRMFSLPNEFPNQWHRLFNSESDAEHQMLHLGNLIQRFPFFAQSQEINSVNIVEVRFFTTQEGFAMRILKSDQVETLADNPTFSSDFSEGAQTGKLRQYVVTEVSEPLPGFWGIQFNQDEPITEAQLNDAWLVIKYEINI